MHPAAAPRAGRPQPQRLPAAGHGGGRLPAGPGARIAAWRSSRRPPSPSGTDPCAAASPRRPHPTRKWAVTGSPGCRREHRPPRLRQAGGLGPVPATPPQDVPPTPAEPPGSAATTRRPTARRGERPSGGGGGWNGGRGPAARHAGSGSSRPPSRSCRGGALDYNSRHAARLPRAGRG